MSIVKSFSIGNGDMFYINHNSDNFTIIDCCMGDEDRARIVAELKHQSNGKGVVRFISTHPDEDHILGLRYLHRSMNLLNFYCLRNDATKEPETDSFDQYCALRDDAQKAFYLYRGCSRKWMNIDNEERKHSGLHVLWPITTNEHYKEALQQAAEGESANNISIVLQYNCVAGKIAWMGDLETEFMEAVEDEVVMDSADILFAPHHGRDSGEVPAKWLGEMDPNLIVIGEAPSEHLNYYAGYNTITQNSAGDITLECVAGKTHIYVSNNDYSVDFLDNEYQPDTHGTYIGTLQAKA
jgi:beta-lactamase superfamily II metal-dependent hydrolase